MNEIYIIDDEKFYKNIRKNLTKKQKVHFIYKNNDIIDDSQVKKFKEVELKIYAIHALNIKNMKERYSYIYDIVCNFLDREFMTKDICNFVDGLCISVRNKSHCPDSKYGCCYGTKRGLCKNFKNGHCVIKSISCKLFTCRYLKKNNKCYHINDIPLLKYFFNTKQKFILSNSLFKDKDDVILLLLKNRNFNLKIG